MHDCERPPEAASYQHEKDVGSSEELALKKTIAQLAVRNMNDLLQSLSSTFDEGFLNDF